MLGMAYYYTEMLYLFKLFCLCSTCIGLIAGLYLFLLLCAKCSMIIGQWLYKKIHKEGKDESNG